jgi:hypothetical protein
VGRELSQVGGWAAQSRARHAGRDGVCPQEYGAHSMALQIRRGKRASTNLGVAALLVANEHK